MSKEEFVAYKLKAAHKTLAAAKVLAENNFWNSVVNRLYYSLFYAISALLELHDIPSKSHSALKSQFSLYFIKEAKFDKKYGRLFSELFDWRQKADYENIFDFRKDEVESLFEPVAELIGLIEEEISKSQ